MFEALDTSSNELVAVKIIDIKGEYERVEKEVKALQKCSSKYIVRYIDALRNEEEEWVRAGDWSDYLIACNGVLQIWFHRELSKG